MHVLGIYLKKKLSFVLQTFFVADKGYSPYSKGTPCCWLLVVVCFVCFLWVLGGFVLGGFFVFCGFFVWLVGWLVGGGGGLFVLFCFCLLFCLFWVGVFLFVCLFVVVVFLFFVFLYVFWYVSDFSGSLALRGITLIYGENKH